MELSSSTLSPKARSSSPSDCLNLVCSGSSSFPYYRDWSLDFETNLKPKEIGNLSFDKDDQLAVDFVTAAANIRAASFGIPLHSLFKAKGIAGNIVHAVATTNATIAGLIVIEAIKVLQKDSNNYRMTYCLEHITKKMLLMPVEPYEPNNSCYVCSETPLSLEINTHCAKLREFVEKIVKAQLGMNFQLIMHGSNLLYEVGNDLDEDEVANYAANLEKVAAAGYDRQEVADHANNLATKIIII